MLCSRICRHSVVLQGCAGLPADCLDVWQVSHCDLGMVTDGVQCVCARLLGVPVLGVQPQTNTTSLSVLHALHFVFIQVTVCESVSRELWFLCKRDLSLCESVSRELWFLSE